MNFTRSQSFDPAYVHANMMGPNALKILEELTKSLDLKLGMRVMDLGCGHGLTSIFLAKEFGVTVYAVDLWISATENFRRFESLGLTESIIPLHLDAHEMPFPEEYFDAVISVDAYHYFGAEEGYLEKNLVPLIKHGGQIGVGVPGFQKKCGSSIPEAMTQWIKPEYHFHTCDWWADLWKRSGQVTVKTSRDMDCCAEAWADWLACDNEYAIQDREMLKADNGDYFSVVEISATRD
jgi:cyclopropane fatty-acyl-phospholipid synthase-like methyltransferase